MVGNTHLCSLKEYLGVSIRLDSNPQVVASSYHLKSSRVVKCASMFLDLDRFDKAQLAVTM